MLMMMLQNKFCHKKYFFIKSVFYSRNSAGSFPSGGPPVQWWIIGTVFVNLYFVYLSNLWRFLALCCGSRCGWFSKNCSSGNQQPCHRYKCRSGQGRETGGMWISPNVKQSSTHCQGSESQPRELQCPFFLLFFPQLLINDSSGFPAFPSGNQHHCATTINKGNSVKKNYSLFQLFWNTGREQDGAVAL